VADELLVGTIVRVDEHPGARAPSLLLTVDLGSHGMQDVVLSSGTYAQDELEGRQILCRLEADGVVVVGAHSHGAGLVLVRPERDVEPGTLVD
jgi:tRNA-binding EMAP/Myf-like protein